MASRNEEFITGATGEHRVVYFRHRADSDLGHMMTSGYRYEWGYTHTPPGGREGSGTSGMPSKAAAREVARDAVSRYGTTQDDPHWEAYQAWERRQRPPEGD